MKVKFRVNLGSRDAGPLGLYFEKCRTGETVDVGDDAADWLIKRGIAEQVDATRSTRPAAKPAE